MGDKLIELVKQEVNDHSVEYRMKDNEDRGIFFCATLLSPTKDERCASYV